MSKHGSARAVLAGAAIAATAGPGRVRRRAEGHQARRTRRERRRHRPRRPRPPGCPARHRSPRGQYLQGAAAAKSFAKANSIPFPVAVGNTWIYQTQAGGQTGRTTNRIVAAGPGSGGYRVTVSSTTDVGGSASTVVPVYTFYPDGTIGYPVPPVSGVPVTGTRHPLAGRRGPGVRQDLPLHAAYPGRERGRHRPGRRHDVGQRPGRHLPGQRGQDDHHRAGADRSRSPSGSRRAPAR